MPGRVRTISLTLCGTDGQPCAEWLPEAKRHFCTLKPPHKRSLATRMKPRRRQFAARKQPHKRMLGTLRTEGESWQVRRRRRDFYRALRKDSEQEAPPPAPEQEMAHPAPEQEAPRLSPPRKKWGCSKKQKGASHGLFAPSSPGLRRLGRLTQPQRRGMNHK